MKDRLGDRARLLHIRDAIEEIESYISCKTLNDLESDSMLRNAVLRQLEIIGEAVNSVKIWIYNFRHPKLNQTISEIIEIPL